MSQDSPLAPTERMAMPILSLLLSLLVACGGGQVRTNAADDPACRASPAAVEDEISLTLDAPPEGPVTSVRIAGLRSLPERIVRDAIASRAGAPLDPETVQGDVRRIFALEAFEDVRVDAARDGAGVALTYEVVERPLVGRVVFDGADGISEAESLSLLRGEVYLPGRVERSARRLAVSLRQEGHLDARASVRALRASPDRVDLCFVVEAGPRYRIERFVFDGAARLTDVELASQIRTFEGTVNVEGGVYRADLLERDLTLVQALYYDRGMVMAEVGAPRMSRSPRRGRVAITIPVREGPVFSLGEITVTGDLLTAAETYLAQLGVGRGEVFSRTRLLEGMARIEALDRELGRERVEVLPLSEVDDAEHRVDLEIELRDPSRPPPEEVDVPPARNGNGEDERPNRLVPDLELAPEYAPPPSLPPGSSTAPWTSPVTP